MNDPKIKQESEKELEKLENEKGLVCLLNILTIKKINNNIKKIAAIRFKNIINNKWKKLKVEKIFEKFNKPQNNLFI